MFRSASNYPKICARVRTRPLIIIPHHSEEGAQGHRDLKNDKKGTDMNNVSHLPGKIIIA